LKGTRKLDQILEFGNFLNQKANQLKKVDYEKKMTLLQNYAKINLDEDMGLNSFYLLEVIMQILIFM